jgi:ubiquinone biosynthesis protein Coq4
MWQASQIDLAFIDDNFLKTIQSFLQIGTKWQKTFGAIKKLGHFFENQNFLQFLV